MMRNGPPRAGHFYFASALSTSAFIAASSGVVRGPNTPAIEPSLLIRHLWKFHLGAASSPSSPASHLYIGCAFAPITSSFAAIGKSTPKRVSQNVLISPSVPGSCAPKLLAGTPSTTSPLSFLSFQSCSRPTYCGDSPHRLATFTTSTALPLNFDIGSSPPSMPLNLKSCAVVMSRLPPVLRAIKGQRRSRNNPAPAATRTPPVTPSSARMALRRRIQFDSVVVSDVSIQNHSTLSAT